MKLGMFTDTHYSSKELTCGKRRNNLSLGKIKDAYEFFKREGCDLVVSLGDLIDVEHSHELEIKHLSEVGNLISSYGMPTVCLMGNHDAFAFEKDEFYSVLGGFEPQNTLLDGKLLLFLDACFFRDGRHYAPGDDDWENTFLPTADKLKETLDSHGGEAIIFIHQNIDPAISNDHRLHNADEVFEIINSSGKVKHVFQGHYHAGNTEIYDGVLYSTLPAVCENQRAYFIFDI